MLPLAWYAADERTSEMNWRRTGKLALGTGLTLLLGAEAGWAAYSALRYLQYPAVPRPSRRKPGALDLFMPEAEVDEEVAVHVAASPAETMAAAQRLDLLHLPVARTIFATRAVLLRTSAAAPAGPFLDAVTSLGWGLLAEEPGTLLVFGAVTRPWEGNVVFRALEPREFVAFAEPEFAKIVWTLQVEAEGTGTRCSTQTRVTTTDARARRKFRRYWSLFSPGILLVRHLALRAIKRAAEREARR